MKRNDPAESFIAISPMVFSSVKIELVIIGLPNSRTISKGIKLSGIRIPTVFLFLNNLGNLLLPFKIKVNGPGNDFFINLKISVLNGFVKSEIWLRS